MRVQNGATPPTILSGGDLLIAPDAEPAPAGRAYTSFEFRNPGGDRIHGFVVEPEGQRPHPLVMEVHGGPQASWKDSFSPAVQALVDHGYAVALVNYRGSTGYGRELRDAILGNPGFVELEDIAAGLDALVENGIADPARAVIAGSSWGGYITLLALGMQPERWVAGVGIVPVADYISAFRDEAPALQAMDVSLFQGSPDELHDKYVERSPITYADRVVAPVLIIAGDNDVRCPIQQVLNYIEVLEARGAELEVYRFDAGHGSLVLEERLKQMELEIDFLTRRVPTASD